MLEEPITQQAWLLHRTITEADITVGQPWWRYFRLGGHAGQLEVDAYLHQALHLPRHQLLDQAAQELTPDSPPTHPPRRLPDEPPSDRPSAVTAFAARAVAHRSCPTNICAPPRHPYGCTVDHKRPAVGCEAAFQEVDGEPTQ